MAPFSRNKPLSFGQKLLDRGQKSGALPDAVLPILRQRYAKNQSERHAATFKTLLELSENTSLFLPIKGKYQKPFALKLIENARPFVGELNEARDAYRGATLFDVRTPECSHGLGCADWVLHCHGVKNISEQYLKHIFADYNLTPQVIGFLSLVRIGLTMYGHDVPEDNRARNKKITPGYYARNTLSLVLSNRYAKIMTPVVTADVQAFTDKLGLRGKQRLDAQKIPPQKEWELLRRMGIIDDSTVGTGLIGTGKYVDKGQQTTSDMLCVLLGRESFFRNPLAFLTHVEPRIDIISSLHVPDTYKTLYTEIAERTLGRMQNPLKTPLSQEEAQKVIHYELTRIQKVLSGGLHIPVNKKVYSLPSLSDLAPKG